VIAAALALSLVAAQAGSPVEARELAAAALAPAARPLAQEDWENGWDDDDGDDEDAPRLFLTAWGGEALDEGGGGHSSSIVGGEAAWAFRSLDLGLAGYGYRGLVDAREWTPVALVRLAQRFRTRAGIEATLALGIGAGRPDGWTAWYQLALGGRATFGRMFVAGEISFEQYDLLRLAAGLGVAF
jgi:hypothetical protein